MVASAHDVVAHILAADEEPSQVMRLHRLCYFCQLEHLSRHGEPLFHEKIYAWAAGPAVKDVYELHRGVHEVSAWPRGVPLGDLERETVNFVLEMLGGEDPEDVAQESRNHEIWKSTRARYGLYGLKRGEAVMDLEELRAFAADKWGRGK